MGAADERGDGTDRRDSRRADNAVVEWVLQEGDRRAVTGLFIVAVFASLVAVGQLYRRASPALRTGDPVETLFQALVGGIITGVTLVVTLNQLVLSQELGAVGDQRDRLEGAVAFRRDAADAVGRDVSDPDPAAFLADLVTATAEAAEDLDRATGEDPAVAALVDGIVDDADEVVPALEGSRFGTFDVLSPALAFNYSSKLVAARALRRDDAHGIDDETAAGRALSHLIRLLELYATAREHFKTLFFQRDLVTLSRRIVLLAVPALVVAAGMILYVDPTAVRGTVVGVDTLVLLVAAAATASVVPFLLLLSHILRIARVTGQTLSIGAFVLRPSDESSTGEGDH